MTTFMRPRLDTAAARTSRKAQNVRLRTVIRGLRSSRPVMSRIPIGLSVTASTTINPAIAKWAIRRGEGSTDRSIDFLRERHGPGKAAGAKKLRSLQRHPHCVDVRRRRGTVEREYHDPGEHLLDDFPHDFLPGLETAFSLPFTGGKVYQEITRSCKAHTH